MKRAILKFGALVSAILVLLALAVPALAGVRPDDRPGPRGPGGRNTPANVRPDDRSGVLGVGVSIGTSLRPDDRAGFRGPAGGPRTIAFGGRHSVPRAKGGFDWAAAGAGAATAAVLMLFLTWVLTLRRNHRREGVPA